VQGISDSIIEPGLINIDFADVVAVMKNQGNALMAIGYGSGPNRVEEAVSCVLDNPLMEGASIRGATRALIYVAGSEQLPLKEFESIVKQITDDMDSNAILFSGLLLDPKLEDNIRVTVIATGFNSDKEYKKLEVVKPQKTEIISDKEFGNLSGSIFNTEHLAPRNNKHEYRYASEDLDVPTVIRDRWFGSSAGEAALNTQTK
jgi:cell division protein FtsZ